MGGDQAERRRDRRRAAGPRTAGRYRRPSGIVRYPCLDVRADPCGNGRGRFLKFDPIPDAVQRASAAPQSGVRAFIGLFLALRAPEGRAPVLGESLDDAAAAGGLAFLAFAVVDLERMLEIAEFARGL